MLEGKQTFNVSCTSRTGTGVTLVLNCKELLLGTLLETEN